VGSDHYWVQGFLKGDGRTVGLDRDMAVSLMTHL
jgi:hypothetical protein